MLILALSTALCSAATPADPVAAIRAELEQALPDAPRGVTGMTLWVTDARGQRVIDVTVGTFDPDATIAVASASKLVSALVLLRLVDQGVLSLQDTAGDVLGWTGPTAGITLDELGGFTSGLAGDRCTYNPLLTLAACVDRIGAHPPQDPPGAAFDYGSAHLQVAARMAEVRTGRSWNDLYRRELADPLGVSTASTYTTLPQRGIGRTNPLVAGGLRLSTAEYQRVLDLVIRAGTLPDGRPWIGPATLQRLQVNRHPQAQVRSTPLPGAGLGYSFGAWLMCPGRPATCDRIASPGAYGFSPWVDLGRGYTGVLAMEADALGSGRYSVPLMERLRPWIEAALDAAHAPAP